MAMDQKTKDEEGTKVSESDVKGTAADGANTESTSIQEKIDEVEAAVSDLPEDVRKQIYPMVEKAFKRAWTRKTQAISAERKLKDKELDDIRLEHEYLKKMSQEVLNDPTKIEYYRSELGIKPSSKEEPKIETVEDLIKYFENKLDSKLSEKDRQTRDSLMRHESDLRWKAALDDHRKDPDFSEFEDYLVGSLYHPESSKKYMSKYTGSNEGEILNSLKEGFREKLNAKVSKLLEEKVAEYKEGLKDKREASTMVPNKKIETQTRGPGKSKEDIIASIRKKFGE